MWHGILVLQASHSQDLAARNVLVGDGNICKVQGYTNSKTACMHTIMKSVCNMYLLYNTTTILWRSKIHFLVLFLICIT